MDMVGWDVWLFTPVELHEILSIRKIFYNCAETLLSPPRFADIGDYLKEKYDKSAVKVSGLEGGKSSERFRRGVTDSPAALPVSKR